MKAWSNSFKIVFAVLTAALVFLVISTMMLKYDLSFQATASIGLKIEPAQKEVTKPILTNFITMP